MKSSMIIKLYIQGRDLPEMLLRPFPQNKVNADVYNFIENGFN